MRVSSSARKSGKYFFTKNLISADRLKALDSDIKALMKAYQGKPPVTMVQRLVYAAIGSAGSVVTGGVGAVRDRDLGGREQ